MQKFLGMSILVGGFIAMCGCVYGVTKINIDAHKQKKLHEKVMSEIREIDRRLMGDKAEAE